MKITTIFLNLTLVLLIAQFTYSQQLFSIHELDSVTHENITSNLVGDNYLLAKKHTIFYDLNIDIFNKVLQNQAEKINLKLPFFNNELLDLNMEEFTIYSDYINVVRSTRDGVKKEQYYPSLKTYKIQSKDVEDISGVLIFTKKGVRGILSVHSQTYQIDIFSVKSGGKNIHFIMNSEYSPIEFNFECHHDELPGEPIEHAIRTGLNSQKCVEIIMEIDYQTYTTFDNYQESIDWALEIIAVSSSFYEEEIGISLISNIAKVWEIEDPYSGFIEDANSMLYAIRENWMNNEELSYMDRDLVHLFSKRNDTGTGGIAFLNGVSSNLNGYGFSSNLTDDSTYSDIPVPYFFWNIYCFMHELGHNFGAKHTQWCGWPGGPIDNCVDIEEVNSGECADYINNPTPQVGTIMSYCHTWPYQLGGGIVMKLHDFVKADMIDYFLPLDLPVCNIDDFIFGCMDEAACNYNTTADLDDDSCIYSDGILDCFGECVNDQNDNGICDENEQLALANINEGRIVLYPNPTNNFLHLTLDNLSIKLKVFELYNSVGQLIYRSHIDSNLKIDVSMIPRGIYLAHILLDSKIIPKSIIIQ